jgi:hypothetical protein
MSSAGAVAAKCPICGAPAGFLRAVDDVSFFRCTGCASLYAHPDFLAAVDQGTTANYGDEYWADGLPSARERSYGPGIARVAEVVRMSRIPVRRFLDIGTGPGYLLDALTVLLPNAAEVFHGVELLPPPVADRSSHPNYHIGTVGDLEGLFDGGVCIEVIEHLTPAILRTMVAQLAARSTPGALYYFNSAQPSFVDSTDPGYLDPKRRGHIVSWSIEGVRNIFSPAGFNVISVPGRDWAFFAEFCPPRSVSVDNLISWLWRPVPQNLALFRKDAFGQLLETIGVESSLCYLQGARANWAITRALVREVRAGSWPGARTVRRIVSRLGMRPSR